MKSLFRDCLTITLWIKERKDSSSLIDGLSFISLVLVMKVWIDRMVLKQEKGHRDHHDQEQNTKGIKIPDIYLRKLVIHKEDGEDRTGLPLFDLGKWRSR